MEAQASKGAVINCRCATSKGQAGKTEPFGPVHVRVRSEDEDSDKKRSATRSCNGPAFSIHSMGTVVPPRRAQTVLNFAVVRPLSS